MPRIAGNGLILRRLAKEGEERLATVQGGNALCQAAVSALKHQGGHIIPAGTVTYRWAMRGWFNRRAPWATEWWRPVDEVTAEDRRSSIFVGPDQDRLNNGRGSDAFDCALPETGPDIGPVALKGGNTAGDLALGRSAGMLRAVLNPPEDWREAGWKAPQLWLGILTHPEFDGRVFPYHTGVPMSIILPRESPVQVRWLDLNRTLAQLSTWEVGDGSKAIYVRAEKRDVLDGHGGLKKKVYPRVHLNLTLLAKQGLVTKPQDWKVGITLPLPPK